MNTEFRRIEVAGLPVEIVRKDIKNLHLGVYPPMGRVRVAAPLLVSDEAVRLAVIGKLGWIKKQRTRFEGQARQSAREMVQGESHYLFGQRYRLRVVERPGPARLVVKNKRTLELQVRPGLSASEREQVLYRFYRRELRQRVPPLLAKWKTVLGVEPSAWGIKKMKTKWGSCNPTLGRIWLNVELAKKPEACLEYLLVHELTHLLERQHNARFLALLDRHLPSWPRLRDLLNSEPLAHEGWGY